MSYPPPSYPPQRYNGAGGAVSATLRPAGTPPDLAIGARARVSYLATGATTDGLFGLYRWDMPALAPSASTPSGHYHRTIAESFYILDGTVSLYNGESWVDATPGDYLYVPAGGIHGFRNNSGAAASMLILFTPGAPREAYFVELAEIAASGRELSADGWTELWARHDQYEA
jgi:mannose-6-phosphate isomerase-like protein (cupin superfamily)